MRPLQLTILLVPAAVSLYLCVLGVAAGENLALGKPAWQSSTKRLPTKPTADKAVDGNDDSNFKSSSCTHTKPGLALPWWVVDLGDVYHVSSVTITNRGDCCAERLRDFNIALMSRPPNEEEPGPEVYDVIFNQTDALAAGETKIFLTDDTPSGQYLVIQLLDDSDPLTLCEVQVAGHQCEVSDENLALDKSAWQSSTSLGVLEEAANAVDGNADSNLGAHSCSSTSRESKPWWVVDLGDVYHVTSVTITNRGDCCSERLRDFNIALISSPATPAPDVYDVIYHQTEAMASGETATFASDDDTLSGRYLVIQLLGDSEMLTLCEVQVFGYHCVDTTSE